MVEFVGDDSNNTLTGGIAADNVAGNGGDDLLNGQDGNDTLNGNTGNDTLLGGNGEDSLRGGIDNDSVSGEAGADTLTGDKGTDTLSGGDGNDILYGDGTVFTEVLADSGNDLLNGDAGDDLLFGGDGNDTLLGGDGNDSLYGEDDAGTSGAGSDSLDGGDGDDVLQGNRGADSLQGGLGNDTLQGGQDNDLLEGGDGLDTLMGESGDDSLYGQGGNDVLSGGLGNDTLNGGLGQDSMIGEDGNDLINGEDGNDTLEGGTGLDTLRGDGGNDYLQGNTGNDSLQGGEGLDSLYGGQDQDTLEGGNGDDLLSGDFGHDYVLGEAGNDLLMGGDHNDILLGGIGNDTLDGGTGLDSLNGQEGNDRLVGQTGNDTLSGEAGNDTLYGGGDQDSLSGGIDEDFLFGDDGNDTLNGDAGHDYLNGGTGNDWLRGGEGIDTLNGGQNEDSLEGGNANDFLYGDLGHDTLKGEDGDDYLDGGDHNDLLFGGIGNDTALGGIGQDYVFGQEGNDVLRGGNDNDSLSGEAGTDLLKGDLGDDTLSGGLDNDTLYGDNPDAGVTDPGAGNDILYGGGGADSLYGGAGNDRLDGGDDNDTLQGNTGYDTMLGGLGNDWMNGGYNADSIEGGDGADTILGDMGRDNIQGNTGNDFILGGQGYDFIRGGQGDDFIDGGTESDTLAGDLGNDTLKGAQEADVFVMTKDGGIDLITDFSVAEAYEKIDLRALGLTSLTELQMTNGASGAQLSAGNSQFILQNVQAEQLTSAEFIGSWSSHKTVNIYRVGAKLEGLQGGVNSAAAARALHHYVIDDITEANPNNTDLYKPFTLIDLSAYGLSSINLIQSGSSSLIDLGLGRTLEIRSVLPNQLGANNFLLSNTVGQTTPDYQTPITRLLSDWNPDHLITASQQTQDHAILQENGVLTYITNPSTITYTNYDYVEGELQIFTPAAPPSGGGNIFVIQGFDIHNPYSYVDVSKLPPMAPSELVLMAHGDDLYVHLGGDNYVNFAGVLIGQNEAQRQITGDAVVRQVWEGKINIANLPPATAFIQSDSLDTGLPEWLPEAKSAGKVVLAIEEKYKQVEDWVERLGGFSDAASTELYKKIKGIVDVGSELAEVFPLGRIAGMTVDAASILLSDRYESTYQRAITLSGNPLNPTGDDQKIAHAVAFLTTGVESALLKLANKPQEALTMLKGLEGLASTLGAEGNLIELRDRISRFDGSIDEYRNLVRDHTTDLSNSTLNHIHQTHAPVNATVFYAVEFNGLTPETAQHFGLDLTDARYFAASPEERAAFQAEVAQYQTQTGQQTAPTYHYIDGTQVESSGVTLGAVSTAPLQTQTMGEFHLPLTSLFGDFIGGIVGDLKHILLNEEAPSQSSGIAQAVIAQIASSMILQGDVEAALQGATQFLVTQFIDTQLLTQIPGLDQGLTTTIQAQLGNNLFSGFAASMAVNVLTQAVKGDLEFEHLDELVLGTAVTYAATQAVSATGVGTVVSTALGAMGLTQGLTSVLAPTVIGVLVGLAVGTIFKVITQDGKWNGDDLPDNLFAGDSDNLTDFSRKYVRLFLEDGDDVFFGGDGWNVVFGGKGNDVITGGDGVFTSEALRPDELHGGEGDDYLDARGMNDQLTGGAGNDYILGGSGNDTLFGGDDPNNYYEEARFTGLDGDDTLLGGDGNDVLYGGVGNDLLSGGQGQDVLQGESGNDTLRGGTEGDLLTGDAGDDALYGDEWNDSLYGGIGNDSLFGGSHDDLLQGDDGHDTLNGDSGNDVLQGNVGNDRLLGGDGIDLLNGGKDDDSLEGGTGTDTLMGDLGNDSLQGNTGNDSLFGGTGFDFMQGGQDNDWLDGGSESDGLHGDMGNDTLTGGVGNDALWGGAGADVFRFTSSGNADRIEDFSVLEDVLRLENLGVTNATDALSHGTTSGANTIFTFGSVSITLLNVTLAQMDASDFSF